MKSSKVLSGGRMEQVGFVCNCDCLVMMEMMLVSDCAFASSNYSSLSLFRIVVVLFML